MNRANLIPSLGVLLVVAPGSLAADRDIDFTRDVKPIFEKHCIACHGAEKQRGGLRLDRAKAALAGGNSGVVIKPGDAKSRLLLIVAGLDAETRMPPKDKPPLTADEVGVLRAWVEQGAKWPDDPTLTVAGPRSDHWAFQPIRRPPLPRVAGGRNGVDAFILARLEAERVAPSPEADPVTLIRRLSFDLLGLPPSPTEVDEFVKEVSARPHAAYEELVDRLLNHPAYGERWGRHWLDAARYADSDGFEKDTGRPWAWRWRAWVIDALNRDLPFDQFAVEQLAGDLLPNATVEQKIATGFHRNTLTNKEGGVDQEQFRVEQVVDRVGTTAKVFLGLTMNCCQCHDHKYDPLSQRDFYQFFAFFNSDIEVDLDAPLPGEMDDLKKAMGSEKPVTRALAPTLAMGKLRKTNVLVRGDFLRPGAEVTADTPAVLPSLASRPQTATRLDLANWIVAPENPLTRRVVVNWVWHHHFGRGLVPTLEDFGTQGEKPSHPELLDWLADEFLRRGWSLKELHRLIVTSATYRQSAKARPELRDRDGLNVLLARQNRLRLEAEVLRDNALAVSGLLAVKVGGPSVRPPQPAGISELTYAGSAKWVESPGPDRYRRGLYTWFQRTSPYPMLMTFDAPDSNVCTVRRERTNTPLQALTLMNDPVFVECARALGRRVVTELPAASVVERLCYGFRLCLGRHPTDNEVEILSRLFERLRENCLRNPDEAAKLLGTLKPGDASDTAAWVALARALMNLDEFITRE